MKKRFLILLVTGLFLLGLTGMANAYSISGTMMITSSGQSQSWSIPGLPSNFGGGTLYIEGEGDFDLTSEFLDIYVETGDPLYDRLLDAVSGADADYFYAPGKNGYTWAKFNKTYTLSEAFMSSVLGDNTFDITLDLSSSVDTYWSDDYVSWELTYEPVPEPATMLLLGAGLIGLAGIGRRKKAK